MTFGRETSRSRLESTAIVMNLERDRGTREEQTNHDRSRLRVRQGIANRLAGNQQQGPAYGLGEPRLGAGHFQVTGIPFSPLIVFTSSDKAPGNPFSKSLAGSR